MKKMNNKGFTLAELLIVIAIIAILIAIAIPAFGGALDNAKIQTDHANMRSAYAMAQAASLQGVLFTGADGTTEVQVSTIGASDKYYFQQDGTLLLNGTTNAYKCKATPASADACKASIPCTTTGNTHAVNNSIYLTATAGKVSVIVG